MPYVNDVGWKGQETSKEAAASVNAPTLRNAVYDLFNNGRSWTADEAASALDKDILSIRPRLSELNKMGYITPSGVKRKNASGKNAVVWVATNSVPFNDIMERVRAAKSEKELYDIFNTSEVKNALDMLDECGKAAIKESYKYYRGILRRSNV